jgi:hypothetical protein
MVDILQKRLQARLPPLQGLILVQIHFFPQRASSAKRSRERVLGWLSRSGHADGGPDIEQALHIHMATLLSSPERRDESTQKRSPVELRPSQAA